MKTILSVPRVALLALALGTASTTATFAQTSTTPATTASVCTAGEKHHHDSVLTADEQAQLNKARDAALAANPTLKTEQDNLKQQFEALKAKGDSATSDEKKALHVQAHDLETKLHAAELNLDPTLAPIFAKIKAAHKEKHSE